MDELDRLYRRIVQNIRGAFPELLLREFEVSQLYQQIVPYRTNRRELEFDSNEEYELALMQLLAGLRGYLVVDADLQKAMRTELASPNPELAVYRVFATATVKLAPEALRALERRVLVSEPAAPSGANPRPLSPAEQAALAGRATETVDTTSDVPRVDIGGRQPPGTIVPAPRQAPARPVPRVAAPPGAASRVPNAPARREGPMPSLDARMTAPRVTPPAAAAGATCRYCSGSLPDGRRVTFCPNCGHNLTVQHCPACATELEVDWKFCITCGRGFGEREGKRE